jgi:hypothetical protein
VWVGSVSFTRSASVQMGPKGLQVLTHLTGPLST